MDSLIITTIGRTLGVFSHIELLTIAVSTVLFFTARFICRWLSNDESLSTRVSMMRMLNFLIILAVIVKAFFLHDSDWIAKATQALMVIYFAVLISQIINFYIRQRFGKVHKTNNKTTISDTYSSRGLSLIVFVVMAIIAIISCLRLMGFSSLLEAGGAIGILGLVLAMTQASWAPDIISGLIILNSRFCEDGDVVQLTMDGKEVFASIFKTKLFHTECLDLANNHRIMVRNAKLRDFSLQNLSRFASAKGLRECLVFNIDYKHSQHEVTEMVQRAFAKIDQEQDARVVQHEPEVRVLDTADYAVKWAVYYYIKDVRKLLTIRQLFRAYILEESMRSNISLATPVLQNSFVQIAQN